ncbi:MAG: PH domain-containing protein, partial [Patescibacteria group bacterium]
FFLRYLYGGMFPLIIFKLFDYSLSFVPADSVEQREAISVGFLGFIGDYFWFLLILIVAVSYIWARLTYNYYRYELTETGFRKEKGVIYKKYVTIPYDRIQNVDIYRGILARILGLSDLNIQTAGASAVVGQYGAFDVGAEGRLPALSKEVAEQLRDEVIARAQKSRSGEGL